MSHLARYHHVLEWSLLALLASFRMALIVKVDVVIPEDGSAPGIAYFAVTLTVGHDVATRRTSGLIILECLHYLLSFAYV
jgi:hypothetical protein